MTNIPLRAYIRTIDDLIETHKLNEAILHGNHILKYYPKQIDTYRLIGKALLESGQHEAAETLFNRVLDVYPDDFISNLGLSFIFETRDSLNKSVSRMEQAFELQPANPSIQEELKRLYKQRDGIEPARVRLTRGALLKMYSRSNLHQQAIAETRVALHEHPDRIDFEIVLAKMLVLAGEMIEAVETCLRIISKLPYCFEANYLLFQTLPENLDKYDVSIFHSRLTEIDPYFKYVSKQRPDVFSIPEVAVAVEELQVQTIDSIESINWLDFIEDIWTKEQSELSKGESKDISWEEVLSGSIEATSETEMETEENKVPSTEPIPDWLKPEESTEEEREFTNNLDQLQTEIKEESGVVDEDAPILETSEVEMELPSSIWTQESSEKDTFELEKEPVKEVDISENEKILEQEISQQYFEVVLKDAHDALLSGFPDRAVEGFRQLLQENRMTEKAAEQLSNDLLKYPTNFNLWIILGDSYQRLGMATKALDAYQNAQKYLGA